ncbi:MAG: helix-turn-helix domain-containing protein, partial [Dehalococcoidia bacterium]
MTIRFDDIGNRLRAFRLGSGLSAEEVARELGISRTALYRFEKGEITKIETLDKASEFLGVSVATLLGVGVEYISSAVSYFERIRQIEEHAEQMVVLAGPISYLLATPGFDSTLDQVLRESIPPRVDDHDAAMSEVDAVMAVLRARRETYASRRPSIVNLISAREMQDFLRHGLIGRSDLPSEALADRRAKAAAEVEHLVECMESQPMGVQIGVVVDTLPHVGFQLFGQPDR